MAEQGTSLAGATVAITGGTGSFGAAMVRYLLTRDVGRIHILSRDEAKQDAMRRQLGDQRVRFFVGDVRDRDSVLAAFNDVDFVFHAAALKQVPSCEFFPREAVRTNVEGSHNVIEAAHQREVRSVVCLSTDKAVYPINAMGLSKALMEKTAHAFARNHPHSRTCVSVTRYGNVLYSRGSVVPLFVDQVLAGLPMTLTDPGMTRFLMTLEESVSLVEHALVHAQPGDLFVRKAPASTVADLAHAVANLFGDGDSRQRVIGTRHGEKSAETLLNREERSRAEDSGEYFRVPLDARSLDYELFFDEGEPTLPVVEDYTSDNTTRLDVAQTEALLRQVPEINARLRASGR